MRKLVYLDSSDFSDLSNPATAGRSENATILHALRQGKETNKINILMSPLLLSEAVHATMNSKEASVRRATLMRELCGNIFLRYPTEICAKEIDRALSSETPVPLSIDDVVSADGEWFGIVADANSLREARLDARQEIDETLKRIPRAQRRKLQSQLDPSKGRSKVTLRQLIRDGSNTQSFRTDPMLRSIDQILLVDWFVGDRTDEDVRRYFCDLMNDPYFLFAHALDRTGHREQLYALLRTTGGKLSSSLTSAAQDLLRLFELAAEIGQPIDPNKFVQSIMTTEFKRKLLAGMSSQPLPNLPDAEVDAVIARCPSIATLIHVLGQYLRTFLQSNLMRFGTGKMLPIIPRTSDFGDLMHLLYSPYVDIFRCDAAFGAHLKSYAPVRARIADRRAQILQML